MTTVIVTFTEPAIHRWPEASGVRSYLKEPHRHLFRFRLEVEVKTTKREVELHDLLDAARSWLRMQFGRLDNWTMDFETCSCEFLAEKMAAWVMAEYGGRWGWVAAECWEDGEVGARYEQRS